MQKKRAGNETAASPANGNGNDKLEFENGQHWLVVNEVTAMQYCMMTNRFWFDAAEMRTIGNKTYFT